jgi:hypothetical protein
MLIPAAAYRRGLNKGDPSPYYTPALAQQNSFQAFLNQSNEINDYNQNDAVVDPKFDWASKALQAGASASKVVGESAQNAIANQLSVQQAQLSNAQSQINAGLANAGQISIKGGKGSKAGGNLGALMRALAIQESGGNYGAVNKGSGALGRYQVMPSNVRGWSQQALGHSISTSQFLHSPKLQDAIVKAIFGGYFKKYGAKGALSAWYSGDPNRWKDNSHVSSGPSVAAYVNQVLSHMK